MALCTGPMIKPNKNKGMSCILEGDKNSPFTKLTWVGDSGLSYHLDNNDTGKYDVTIINDITGTIG